MSSSLDIPERESETPMNAEALENLLEKANKRLLHHRDWLAKLPRDSDDIPTVTHPSLNLVTAPPSLVARQNSSPPSADCGEISRRAFDAGANSASVAFSASLSGISATITSLNVALASAQASASVALSSATGSLLFAQSSMNSVVSVAEKSAAMMVASAVDMVASANAAANEAKALATNEIQRAQASIASNNQAAQASILAAQAAAMNTTKFALSLTFAILGSSIITVILCYLVIRWRRRRRERRQIELKEKIHLKKQTPSLLSDAPISIIQSENRNIEQSRLQASQVEPRISRVEPPRGIPNRVNIKSREIKTGFGDYIIESALQPTQSLESSESSLDPLDTNANGKRNLPSEFEVGQKIRKPLNRAVNKDGVRFMDIDSSEDQENSPGRRYTEGFRKISSGSDSFQEKHMTFSPSSSKSSKPSRARKPTLQYDPDRPRDPPTWLVDGRDDFTSTSEESYLDLDLTSTRKTSQSLGESQISPTRVDRLGSSFGSQPGLTGENRVGTFGVSRVDTTRESQPNPTEENLVGVIEESLANATVESRVGPTVEDRLSVTAKSPLDATVESRVDTIVQNRLSIIGESPLDATAESRVGPPVESRVDTIVENRLSIIGESSSDATVESRVGATVENRLSVIMESPVDPIVGSRLSVIKESPVGATVESRVGATVENRVSAIGAAI